MLSKRPPYLPLKKPDYANDRLQGKSRLLDAQFRHLRYDSVESIRDVCYHVAQDLTKSVAKPCAADHNVRQVTPQGNQYSLFSNICLENSMFDRSGIQLQLSFNCPRSLQGDGLHAAGHFERGMLVALVGLSEEHHLSVTYCNVELQESSASMNTIYGNHDKGKFNFYLSSRFLLTHLSLGLAFVRGA